MPCSLYMMRCEARDATVHCVTFGAHLMQSGMSETWS